MKSLHMLGMVALLTGSAIAAESVSSSDVQAKLDALQVKLEHTAKRINQPTASGSSVVGLRGSKQSAAKPLYWKGKETEMPVAPEEVKLFRSAVEQARGGQTAEALAALRSFKTQYPTSGLTPDVDDTIRLLDRP